MYRILGVVCVLLAMAPIALASPAIQTGLMAYYGFDSEANLAADTSGHGFNGTLSNTVGVTAVSGKLGGAVSLANSPPYANPDGPSAAPDFIDLPGASMNPGGLDTFSFSAWVKPSLENPWTNWMILSGTSSTNPGSPNTQFRVMPADMSTQLRLRDENVSGTTTFIDQKIFPAVTDWVHLAFSYDKNANTVNMYANGTNYYSGAPASALSIGSWTAPDGDWNVTNEQVTHCLRLGAAANDQTNGYGGLMDEVYFFNSAITPAQADLLYNVGNWLQGDADKSGTVNVGDLTALLNNYNKSGMGWTDGDFTGDTTVNVADLTLLLNNYNKTFGAITGAGLSAATATPEPSSLVLLATLAAMLGAWLIRRRNG